MGDRATTIKLEKREIFGRALRGARRGGKMPVVIYGAGEKSMPYFVNEIDFMKTWRESGESTMLSLDIDGKHKDALIQEVSFHAVSGKPLHADLLVVDTSKPVEVSVEFEFEGLSPAVKNFGGVLTKVMHELEIRVLPKELPHSLKVDMSIMTELDSKILVKDIILPPSAEPMVDPDEVVILVSAPKEELESAAPVDFSGVEVEKKGKEEVENATEGGQSK